MLSFPLDEMMSIDDFKTSLELKSGIPVREQEILLPKGTTANLDKGLSQFLCISVSISNFYLYFGSTTF